MKKLRKLVSRLNALFHRDRLEQDLDDELAFHQDMQVREKTAAGVDVEQARLEARREFGRPLAVKEACRDLRLIAWIESVIQDIRFGLRSLTKTKGLAVVAVVTLAVGIGANTTMFSAFNALSLQPLPFRDSSSLVLISEWNPRKGVYRRSPKFATVTTILEETDLFENIGPCRRRRRPHGLRHRRGRSRGEPNNRCEHATGARRRSGCGPHLPAGRRDCGQGISLTRSAQPRHLANTLRRRPECRWQDHQDRWHHQKNPRRNAARILDRTLERRRGVLGLL